MKHKLSIFFSAIFLFFALPAAAHAASLYLSPSSGTYTEYDNFSVTLYASSTDEKMNGAAANISFPTNLLNVNSISITGSLIDFWAEEVSYSNTTGIINFAGVDLGGGYLGSAAKLITISFNAVADGTANVTFNSGSVLADDGLGTEILTDMISGSYLINPYPPPSAPTISSNTHPSSAVCYGSNDPSFTWTNPGGITGVRRDINQTADSEASTSVATAFSYSATDIADGKWYIHVSLENIGGWGSTAHYEFNICTPSPPAAPTVSSDTHPNGEVCYENNDPVLTWDIDTTEPDKTTAVYALLDQTADSTPATSIGKVETFSASNKVNGTWYFHIRLANEGGLGAITHYKLQVCMPDLPVAPTVTSPTHPVSDTWYEANDPQFDWTNPSGITGARVLINQTSDSNPTTSVGVVETYSATDVAVAEWYFHVQLQNVSGWGGIAHYKFRINAGCTACPDCPSCPVCAPSTGGLTRWDACSVCAPTEVECPVPVACAPTEVECPKIEPIVCKPTEKECPKTKCPVSKPEVKTEYRDIIKEKIKFIMVPQEGEVAGQIDHYRIRIDEMPIIILSPEEARSFEPPAMGPGGHAIIMEGIDGVGRIMTSSTMEFFVEEPEVITREKVKEVFVVREVVYWITIIIEALIILYFIFRRFFFRW
ncbi:cohesin domain-containing protein [Patescibacteria group bacterium]|nr:cohesin domain-containing protein [Patescibacteria group bacterium]